MKTTFTKNIITALLIASFSLKAEAQDPVFSQFYNSSVYLNPAMVGDEDDIMVGLAYRSQWKSLYSEYETSQASFIYPFFNTIHKYPFSHVGGVGVSVFSDAAGINKSFKTVGGNFSFAYNLQLTSKNVNRISFGLQMGVVNRRIDSQGFQWGSQFDDDAGWGSDLPGAPEFAFQSKTLLDITPGVFYRFYHRRPTATVKSLYSGFSVGHVNHPDQSIIEGHRELLPLLYKYNGGVVFDLSRQASASLNILSLIQDRKNQTNLGAFFSYRVTESLSEAILANVIARVGGWHRIRDSFIVSAEMLTNNIQFGFSHDWNVTNLTRFEPGLGAYEFSLKYKLSRHAPPKVNY